ncbi:MAG TPA: hypothetical protein VGX25_10575 [Actinophytocola sp.]|uniref:hypothetical protein n=1 Tax=Actinophytocola sp. TaxID=1872138 RepID=UPI002DDC9192|nr:hypothetical protein [Actinophytocola sp.]HEV2779830.1 hypothetical protein [Actinophytocola sp.]
MKTGRALVVGLAVAAASTVAAAPSQAASTADVPPGCRVSRYYYSATAWCGADAQPRNWRLVVLCQTRVSYGPAVFWYGYSSAGCFPEYVTDAFIQYL